MFEKKLDFVTWKKRMQYHFDIYKIIGVFLGKMNWEHREAVEWLWRTIRGGRLNIPIQCSVFAGVCTVALGDGGWEPGKCVSHTEWTLGVCTDGPVDTCASGQSMRARESRREAACELPFCLQAVILRKYLAREQRNVKEDCGRSHQFNRKGVIKSPGGKAAR